MKFHLSIFFLWVLAACARPASKTPSVAIRSMPLFDSSRNRPIPVLLYVRSPVGMTRKPLVVISGGYGATAGSYSFIARQLAGEGYLVMDVQQDLPGDEPIAREGNLYEQRMPVWERGVRNVRFAVDAVRKQFPNQPLRPLILIGHSNGGDISVLLAKEHPADVSHVITLDHRRMPIPRMGQPRFLTLRAVDTTADPGVLPDAHEQKQFGIGVISLKNGRHNDLHDGGSPELKQQILEHLLRWLNEPKAE